MRARFRSTALMLAATAAGSCAQFRPPAGGTGGGPPRGAVASAAAPGSCASEAFIDDAEDGDNQILTRGGRAGYLYSFKDPHGSEIRPDGEFSASAGGAHGSRQALRVHGRLADKDNAYAGLGLSFTEPKGPYDATRYQGLAFYARRAPGTAASVRLKVPDVNTDPEGKICSECFNDFGVDFQVTEEWTRYEVSFSDLKQGADWGQPRPAAVDATRLYSVQWQIALRGASFDLWIDDITFVGCR